MGASTASSASSARARWAPCTKARTCASTARWPSRCCTPASRAKADIVERFEREAQAAGRIGSEHIVEVLDLGELPDGTRYMVMEYLDGETLEGRIKRKGRLSAPEAAPLVAQLLEGLDAAHAAGIIHRDLKPANVWLCTQKSGGQRDFVKILDFGVSKFSALDERDEHDPHGHGAGHALLHEPRAGSRARRSTPAATSTRWA
jgi:serine/threonine protein kinase